MDEEIHIHKNPEQQCGRLMTVLSLKRLYFNHGPN